MTKWLALAAGCLFAVSVSAGDWTAKDGKDPHHGKSGCESKDKVARMKQLYGDDFFKQHPQQSKVEKRGAAEGQAEETKSASPDQFI